jgi:lysophospholipase L1-like esterase
LIKSPGAARWRRFVALGDSFTEGMSDPYPDGTYRGWADLVAQRLAAEVDGFGYANLAVRGRRFHQVVSEQVPLALGMGPDLVSFAAGGNDTLRRSFDPVSLVERFDGAVRSLREAGADVIVFRFADVTRQLPGRRLILPRVEILNRAVGEAARRHGAYLIDLWADEAFFGPWLWSVDRLHLSTPGHRRVAGQVLTALGIRPPPEWMADPPAAPAPSWAARRLADARWAGTYFAPWVRRRLTGRSSGDHITAKRPTLRPLSD